MFMTTAIVLLALYREPGNARFTAVLIINKGRETNEEKLNTKW